MKLTSKNMLSSIIVIFMVILIPEKIEAQENKIETNYFWVINQDEKFKISLVDNKYATNQRIESIKETIFSEASIILPDILMNKGDSNESSTYYFGWSGALNAINNTKYPVPQKLIFDVGKIKTGNIIIELTNMPHPEKLAGNSVPLVHNSYMIQNTITIYNINDLTIEQLQIILRHELGHAFGVGHSTDNMDLMYQEITTIFPFISPCVIYGIESLYNGKSNSQFTCEK